LSQLSGYFTFKESNKALNWLWKQAADRDRSSSGRIRSEGDLFLNGAQQCAANASDDAGDELWVFKVQDFYQSCSVQPTSMALKMLLQCCTGWQPVPLPADVSASTQDADC
jgi:pectate lyase